PVRVRLNRRTLPLEAIGDGDAIRRRRSLEKQLCRELREARPFQWLAHRTGVGKHGDRDERQLRDRRDDEPQTVRQRAAFEMRKMIRRRYTGCRSRWAIEDRRHW